MLINPSEEQPRKLTREEFLDEGQRLFGPDVLQWRFKCPACGHVATVQDWKDAGAPEGAVAYSCIGRYRQHARPAFAMGAGPCDYTLGGLICIAELYVGDRPTFEFAPQ